MDPTDFPGQDWQVSLQTQGKLPEISYLFYIWKVRKRVLDSGNFLLANPFDSQIGKKSSM